MKADLKNMHQFKSVDQHKINPDLFSTFFVNWPKEPHWRMYFTLDLRPGLYVIGSYINTNPFLTFPTGNQKRQIRSSTWIHSDNQVFPTEIISMMQLCAEVLVTKPQQLRVLNKNKPVIVWPDSSQPISDFLCRVSSTEQSICQVCPAILGYHFLGFCSQVLSWKLKLVWKIMTLYYPAIVVPHSGKIKHDIATREFMLGLRYHKASLISKWGRL